MSRRVCAWWCENEGSVIRDFEMSDVQQMQMQDARDVGRWCH